MVKKSMSLYNDKLLKEKSILICNERCLYEKNSVKFTVSSR